MKLGLLGLFLLSFGLSAKVDFKSFTPFGGVTSGGGYVIVCEEDKTVELLDFFEASQTIRGYALRDLPAGNDVYQKAHAVIDRIQGFSKDFNQDWHKTLDEFKNGDMTFIDRGVITDINDGRTVVSPSRKCFKVQAGLQVKNPGPYQYRVMIDKDLWNKMNDFTKVGLLVHEVIYKTALAQGHEDSDKVRLVNSFLFSKYTEKFNEFDYLEIFQFAKVDGCFETKTKFTSESYGSSEHQVTYKVSDFKKSQKGFTGNTCGEQIIEKFVDEGTLYLDPQTEVKMNLGSDDICFIKQNASMFQRKEEQHFVHHVCFKLYTNSYHLSFSETSSLWPEFRSGDGIRQAYCSGQEIDGYYVSGCRSFQSEVKIASQELKIKNFYPGYPLEFFAFENDQNILRFGYMDMSMVMLNPHFQVDVVKKEVLTYTMNATSLLINESKSCFIENGDRVHFDLVSGKFKKVSLTRPREFGDEDCAKYFAERESQGNLK